MVTTAGTLLFLLIVSAAVARAAAAVVGPALGALAGLSSVLAAIIERAQQRSEAPPPAR